MKCWAELLGPAQGTGSALRQPQGIWAPAGSMLTPAFQPSPEHPTRQDQEGAVLRPSGVWS